MAVIDKFNINGSNYDLNDAGAVRFDAAQNLTDQQKATGRANIGALADNQGAANAGKALVVGFDGNVTPGEAQVPAAVAAAMLALFQHAAYIDDASAYYNALVRALVGTPVEPFEYGVYEPEEVVSGKYIDSDGTVKTGVANQSYYIKDYIPVVAASYWIGYQPAVMLERGSGSSADLYSRSNWRISEYDTNKSFIKQTQYSLANEAYSAHIVTFDANTRYIRLGWYDDTEAQHVFDIENVQSIVELPMESGDVNASTGQNAEQRLRIRTTGYIPVTETTITIQGCPFASSWSEFNVDSVYGVRCYDSNKNYLGVLSNLPLSDITDEPLLTNTAYVRLIMQYDSQHSFSDFKHLVNHLYTINGIKYYLIGGVSA